MADSAGADPSSKITLKAENLVSAAAANSDARVDIQINSTGPLLDHLEDPPSYASLALEEGIRFNGRLNIVIHIVGSRGDVQPFIALGLELQTRGHRVRIATHGVFREFVLQHGLEFFNIGGDPTELMAYMVKNPGIIPKLSAVKAGEIPKKRQMIGEMLRGCWRSCIDADPESKTPFLAEAIIANPPSYAHVHCAQALGVPLHIMFTMPWTPTRAFPHPLANITSSNVSPKLRNFLSYSVIETMTWQGLGDVINRWRDEALGLPPVPAAAAANLMSTLAIPHTYCWSPALVPKPSDWPAYVDVCGFFFRDPPSYSPPAQIEEFLRSGPTPVYIGFGSIVLEDPPKMTDLILEGVQKAGVRAIVSRGWSKLGDGVERPDVLFIGDCPHEWLFKHVAAVVHHGGAGTTACGLLNACPTTIVPFFGDQPFWGDMVFTAGAGPRPIHHKLLTAERLSDAIKTCLSPSCMDAAKAISEKMSVENGVRTAADSFQRNLPTSTLQCSLLPNEVAVWQYRKGKKSPYLRLSAKAVNILHDKGRLNVKDLQLYRTNEIRINNSAWDPLTAASSALLGTGIDFTAGLGAVLASPLKASQSRESKDGSTPSAGQAVGVAAGKGLGTMTSSLIKGTIVDVPMALADGLNNVPRLYGEQTEQRQPISDWKSGGEAAGKNFVKGFSSGLSGFVTDPYRGAKKGGFLGFAKGMATGSVGLFTKPGAAMFGLIAYPAMGIYQSLYAALSPIQREILAARLALDEYMSKVVPVTPEEVRDVTQQFGNV